MKKAKQRFQKKLSHREDENGISEYDQEYLRTPEHGPLITNDMFAELDSLEFFTKKKIKKFRERLKKSMKRFPSDFEKIESGLKSYVESSTIKTRDLAILISSILRAFGDILTKTYEQADETTQQLINRSYFETFDWLNEFAIEETDMISQAGLELYQTKSNQITINAFHEWFAFINKKVPDNPQVNNYWELEIYTGVNHPHYYHQRQQSTDVLGAYTGLENELFFEKTLLSSYTLSYDVSLRFESGTINQKGQRRLHIRGNPDIVEERIFSSWIVSEKFLDGQYEILCLPNEYNLIIELNKSDQVSADFKLTRQVF